MISVSTMLTATVFRLHVDCIHRVLMQVPQWADPIPMGRRGGPGPRAMSGRWSHGTDYFLGPGIPVLNWQVVVELHVCICRASLIYTQSNSTLLQVSK